MPYKLLIIRGDHLIGNLLIDRLLEFGHEIVTVFDISENSGTNNNNNNNSRSIDNIINVNNKYIRDGNLQVLKGIENNFDDIVKYSLDSDGIIYLPKVVNFNTFTTDISQESQLIERILKNINGTSRWFIYAHDILSDGEQGLLDQYQLETKLLQYDNTKAVIRLPSIIYNHKEDKIIDSNLTDNSSSKFLNQFIEFAMALTFSGYINEGDNIWGSIEIHDLVGYFIEIITNIINETNDNKVYNLITENNTTKDISTSISKKVKIPVMSISSHQADQFYSSLGLLWELNLVDDTTNLGSLSYKPKQLEILKYLSKNEDSCCTIM
ncbi:hypothetical protein WICMUC_005521 [Wickerhamomyces mucosus]|uniref:Uncharacterized protein n=1 Tax=Wickerhamomyces mucosus TaxID=1378264 RepID=A0A9P8P8M9_9ASCO|nr:hypothetical protein WICMUC_005521 [Wickerhamomyces mucosus]